jgi:hypothetical protein
MHRADGELCQLLDILKLIPGDKWLWRVLYFWGVGSAPVGLSMEEFEELSRATSGGYAFTWEELMEFADGLEQTYECSICAYPFASESGDVEDERRQMAAVDAFDSTEWTIELNPHLEGAIDIIKLLENLAR